MTMLDELMALYNIPAKSNNEDKMRKYLKTLFASLGCTVKQDNGNLYITSGTIKDGEYYPCIAAHIDEVHSGRGDYKAVYDKQGDFIYGVSNSKRTQCGIGADDKNGIWVALQCVKTLPYCKVALFKGEEIGCVGSSKAVMKFFKDCRFVLQVDRKGAKDVIDEISCVMISDEFRNDITPLMDKYGRHFCSGLMTDVDELTSKGVGISCINMSCGYYNPHTEKEITIYQELVDTLNFVLDVCINMTKRYEHKAEYSYSLSYGRGGYTSFGILGGWDTKSYESQKGDELDLKDELIYEMYESMDVYGSIPDEDTTYSFYHPYYPNISREKFGEIFRSIVADIYQDYQQ